MSGDDDYDRRREEASFHDRRFDQMRRRYEDDRRRTRAIIDGMRTGDYRNAYKELDIPPSGALPPVPAQVRDYTDETESAWS
ncbi:MAG: hypothetical protein ACM3ST_03870 [Bdellovibrio bacteriovorus]